jgi:hypothetical protein
MRRIAVPSVLLVLMQQQVTGAESGHDKSARNDRAAHRVKVLGSDPAVEEDIP